MNEIRYMSKRQEMICNIAEELAKKSDMEKSKHGAVIVNGKKIIGMGYNRYCKNKKCYSDHAEVDAILNAIKNYGKESLYNSELYVVRISKGGNIAKQSRHEKSRHGTSNYDISRHDTSNYEKSRHGTSNYEKSRHGTPNYEKSRHGTPNYEKSRHGTPNYEKSRHDTSNYDISRHDTSNYDISRHDTPNYDNSMHNLRMSKPCKNCTNFIIKNNINTVYYSID
jgi:deoxycytidylate deaminase